MIAKEKAYVQLDQLQPPQNIDIEKRVPRTTSTDIEVKGKSILLGRLSSILQ